MNSAAVFDPAERTLWWSLPLGLLLWAIVLWGFGLSFTAPDRTASAPPAAIDERIVELPPPPAPPKLPPKPVVKAAPVPVHAAPQLAPIPPKVVVPVAPPVPPPVHADPTPLPPPPPKPQPSPDSSQDGTRQMGARALFQPKPVVPEDLRDETIHVVVTARIHIGTDGNVRVELVKPAPDPRVNQLVLNTLKTWRFFPAIQAGKPVESVQDVKVAIDVD
ncbi:MAG: energy transducer TonB [Sulfuriferula sp.]|nr:energy transducer TonB [Sulfuriferula sp.]